MFKPSSNFLTERSKVVLLLWVPFVICVSCLIVIVSCLFTEALWSPAGKGSLVCDVFLCFCHFLIWCPESGVVFDCIDS